LVVAARGVKLPCSILGPYPEVGETNEMAASFCSAART
jgi:hypothetical protein